MMKLKTKGLESSHCLKLNSVGGVEKNRELKGLIIWAVILLLRRKSSKTT